MGKTLYTWNGSSWVQTVSPDTINGQSVATGGTVNQFLRKFDTTDYNTYWSNLPEASTSEQGIVMLEDSVSSTSTTKAATANSIKTVADAAIANTTANAKGDIFVGTANDTVSVLTVGSNGTVFESDSTTATGLDWFYLPVPILPFCSGEIYSNGAGGSSSAVSEDTTYYSPIFIPTTTTFDRIGCRSGSTYSGTNIIRLGVYDDTNGKPSTVKFDAGTVSITTANTTVYTNINQTLDPGWYWLASNMQTVSATKQMNVSARIRMNSTFPSRIDTAPNSSFIETGITGAFANAGTLTISANSGVAVLLRVA